MRNEFTAIVEQDGPWYVAYCAEMPGANGQGLVVVGWSWRHSCGTFEARGYGSRQNCVVYV